MSEHAFLAPSSAPLWGRCSGSVHAGAGRPDLEVERTRQGTCSHWVMEQCARQWMASEMTYDLMCSDWIGKADPAGTIATEEIAEGAQVILDDMLHVARTNGGYSFLLIEQRVNMTRIHPTANWGTLDLAFYNRERGILYLWDLKFGHRVVRAKGNLQMADYLEGLYEAYALPMDTEVHVRIVQPFAFAPWGAIDEHVAPLSAFIPDWDRLHKMAHEAHNDPKLTAGKHCRDCKGRIDCPAAREYLYAWGSFCEMPYQMDRMTNDDKAREIDLLAGVLSVAKARKEALEDDLSASMAKGEPCSVKVYQTAQGPLAWGEGMKPAAIAAFKSLGVCIEKNEPVTPRQALQKVPKEKREQAESILASLAKRKNSMKLVDSDDSLVARAFSTKPTGV